MPSHAHHTRTHTGHAVVCRSDTCAAATWGLQPMLEGHHSAVAVVEATAAAQQEKQQGECIVTRLMGGAGGAGGGAGGGKGGGEKGSQPPQRQPWCQVHWKKDNFN